MIFYKRVLSITNVLWSYTWKMFIPLLFFLGITEGYFIYNNIAKNTFRTNSNVAGYPEGMPWAPRFEGYLLGSHVEGLFMLALLITIVILISIPIRQKLVAKTEYTYHRLPVSRFTRFFTSAFYCSSILVILFALQLIIILVAYEVYLHFLPEEAVMTQGLFLSFIRWGFLKTVYPISDPLKIIRNILYFIHAGFAITHISTLIIYRKKPGLNTIQILLPYLFIGFEGMVGIVITFTLLILNSAGIIIEHKVVTKTLEEEKIDVKKKYKPVKEFEA